jgi:hypothetical protein
MVVKGSKQYRTRVVPYRPFRRAVWVMVLTLLVCALCALSAWWGYQEAQRFQQLALNEWEALRQLVKEQAQEIEQLNTSAVTAQTSADIDKQALEALRQEIVQLNKKIAELEESNDFYRKIMEPRELTKGLAIGSFTLTPVPQSGEYHYQLVVQQFARDPRVISGRLNVSFVGLQAGQTKTYALHEVSDNIDEADIPFKFRFYQSVEGNLTLPEDFVLQRVDVLAEKKGSTTPIVRSFDQEDGMDQAH